MLPSYLLRRGTSRPPHETIVRLLYFAQYLKTRQRCKPGLTREKGPNVSTGLALYPV